MKELDEVLRRKETDIVRVRHEIESLRLVAFILSDQLRCNEEKSAAEKDAYALLRHTEADVVRVRHEIESLQIAIFLLSDDFR